MGTLLYFVANLKQFDRKLLGCLMRTNLMTQLFVIFEPSLFTFPKVTFIFEGTMLATVLMAPQAVGLGIQIGCG